MADPRLINIACLHEVLSIIFASANQFKGKWSFSLPCAISRGAGNMSGMVPVSFTGTHLGLQRARQSLEPGAWLVDSTISLVYNHFQKCNGSPLAQTVLLIDAGVSALLANGDDTDANATVVELDLQSRELILIPVNNSRSGDADTGDHWSLLFAWKISAQARSLRFTVYHADSIGRASSLRCANQISSKFSGLARRRKSCDVPSSAKVLIVEFMSWYSLR